MTSIGIAKKDVPGIREPSDPHVAGRPAPDPFEASEERRNMRVLTTLISAELVLFLIDGLITLFWRDWKTLSAVAVATVLQLAPLWLIRHRNLQAGAVLFVLINILVTTAIAMVGQGIYDIAIIAFPIIFVFAGICLRRTLFRLCVGLGVAAVCWLVAGENIGWIVPQPMLDDPFHVFYLVAVVALLLVAAFAVNVLVANLRNSLAYAQQEIEERKKIEAALRSSEDNFRTLTENLVAGVFVFQNGNLVYVNPALSRISGYQPEEIIGKLSVQDLIHPDDLPRAVEMLRARLNGQPGNGDSTPYKGMKKDGSIRYVEIYGVKITYRDQPAVLGTAMDVTERRKTEEALKESEAKYRQLFDNSEVAMYRSRVDGSCFLDCNDKLLEIFGYTREELLGRPSFSYWADPQERAQIRALLEVQGSVIDFECQLRRKRGEIRRCLVSSRMNRESGVWEGSILDVTERRKAEQALVESEERYRTLFEKSAEGILIADVRSKKLRHANPAICKMLGYSQGELLSMSLFDIHPRDTLEHVAAEFMAAARGERDKTTMLCLKKDGRMIDVEIHSATATIDGRESNVGFFTDVTDQKQAAARLEHAAQEWRTTFDSIGDFISIHDRDNRIIRVNRAMASLLNKTPQELIGRFCHEVMHGTSAPPENCPNRLTLLTGKPEIKESFHPVLELHLQESTSPMLGEHGEIIGSVNVIRDMTKSKRMEEQLLITDRLASIGELASGIAHELNNPLTSVIGFSQLLMESEVPDNMREDLSTVCSEAQRAAVIVKNLLTFARKHAPVKQLSQVNTVVEDVLRLRAYEQKVNNIEVETHLAAGLPQIMMDHFQMQQVFLNIIVNAEFAMLEAHQRGKLVITTERSDGHVKTVITDDGPGIKPENLQHIFDPFFTTKEVGKGTGLGLSICHGIVSEHGGQIYAENGDGRGATFVVELPLNGQ